MSEVNIKEQISKLIDLQTIDSEIYRLKKEKEEKPQRIAELQKEFESKKENLKDLEEKTKSSQVKIKSNELELQAKEENITKSQTQLYQIKTNKEYQAKLLEIEGFKADKSVIEEDILKKLEEIDVNKRDIEKEKNVLAEEEKVFNQQKKEVEQRVKEIEDRLHQLDAQRKQIIPNIDKKVLQQYERVLVNREGLALVAVKDFSCQGCFMNVPPQVVNEIKMKARIVVCEVCTRILYIEGEF